MDFVLIKIIARSVNTFIPLGDETINSSLTERGRSLIYPQPHIFLYILVRIKPTDVHECLSSDRQKCGSHKGKDLGCTDDVEMLPS